MTDPIAPITLPPVRDPERETLWLQEGLQRWLDSEFLPEPINVTIARRAAQIFVRHRLEGEDDLGALTLALVLELQSFDFTYSFYGECAIANAVSDLVLASLGVDRCCGS